MILFSVPIEAMEKYWQKVFQLFTKPPDEELMKIMKEFRNGLILKIVEKYSAAESVKEQVINFLIYGAMAEIFARETGFTGRILVVQCMLSSHHLIYPNNAIVGGSDIAVRVALYKKLTRKKVL